MRRAPGSQEAHGEAGRALNPRLACMDFIRGWRHHMHKGKLPEDQGDKSTVAPGTQQGTYGRKQARRSSSVWFRKQPSKGSLPSPCDRSHIWFPTFHCRILTMRQALLQLIPGYEKA